jgi:outer membrane lipoprotein SlyB
MRTYPLVLLAGGALAALLTGCGSPAPVASATPATTATASIPATLEYGRVTNIESIGGTGTAARTGPSVPGAILGAVAGGVVGNQIGSGTGRTAATVLGAAGGAAVGSQVGRSSSAPMPQAAYRVTVQTEGGSVRYYDVPDTAGLRVGDRVHVEHGVISRVS